MTGISRSTYDRMTEAQWIGKKVRLLAPVQTRGGVCIPAGCILTITGKYGGFSVTSDPCECCGVQVKIKGLAPSKVELIG